MAEDRFNVFQRLAAGWEDVHPYNAVQACMVAGTFESERLASATRYLTLDDELPRFLTTEMNRPFAHGPPIRPFFQPTDDGAATWFGVVYRHRAADGYFIRSLIRNCVATRTGQAVPPPERVRHVRSESPGAASLLDLLRRYGDYRRARKVHTMGPLDYPVRVRLLEPLRGVVPPLLAYARSRGVKLNDVFVAALAEVCDRFVPCQRRPGRHDLAVSSIVDLRPYLSDADDRTGDGCHLGFTGVVCPSRDVGDWDRLLRRVAAQHRAQRSGRLGPPGLLWMHAAERASRFSRPERLYDFYRKEAPFAGGISNVNLNGTWFARQRPGLIRDYVRVSPTGPMLPVVINVTTLGDDLRLTMTYRSALFNDWAAAELAQAFVRRITNLA